MKHILPHERASRTKTQKYLRAISFSKIYSAQTVLLEPKLITIETDVSRGLFNFSIVGLPDKALEEAKDRVVAAIKNSDFESPKSDNHKIIVSLAPADLKKEGSGFDVGIALGYLRAKELIDFDTDGKLFLGELSLDGEIRRMPGVHGPWSMPSQAAGARAIAESGHRQPRYDKRLTRRKNTS